MDNQDNFKGSPTELDSPGNRHVTIVPHDTDLIVPPPRALYIGGAGNLVCSLIGKPDEFVTYFGLLAGTTLPIRPAVIKTLGAGTTATNIVGIR